VTSLRTTSLTQLAYLNESVQTPMVSTKTSCICLFIVLGSSTACVRLLPFALCYVMSASWCSCILGISQRGCYFSCRLLIGYPKLKHFCRNDLWRLDEGFLNGPLLWVYDGRQGLEMCALHLVCTTLSRHSDVPQMFGCGGYRKKKEIIWHFEDLKWWERIFVSIFS